MNRSNGNTGGYDPVSAFEHRRQIFNTVQEIQRREHEAMASIARSIEANKRALLVELSRWLLQQVRDHPSHQEVQRLCGCRIAEWLELQAAAKSLDAEVRNLEQAVTRAHDAYRSEEPWGHVGLGGVAEAFASDERRRKLQALNAITERKSVQLNDVKARLEENVKSRKRFGKRFLRSCLQNVRELEDSAVFGNSTQQMIREMNTSIEREWEKYQSYHKRAMDLTVAEVNRLRASYFGEGQDGG